MGSTFFCRECQQERSMQEFVDIKEYAGICYTCYQKRPKQVCVDFDGVLAEYSGWRGPTTLGAPIMGAEAFLKSLNEMGFQVVIHTTRDPDTVQKWLADHGLGSFVKLVTREKVPAVAYIDDRAICFRGAYEETLASVRSFLPYWKQNPTDSENKT